MPGDAIHAPPVNTEAEDALREKLDTARRQRILNQKLAGKSLGEQLGGEEMDSAAAWVAKSRVGEEERKAKAAAPRKAVKKKPKPGSALDRFDEMDELDQQGESQVGGAYVGHSIDDFKVGEEVTLTIADQNVLDGDEVNDADEVLENVNMTDLQRRDHRKELASTGKYDPFADNKSVLSKYDDEKKMREEGSNLVRLDASGGVNVAKAQRLAEVKARLQQTSQGADSGAVKYDLMTSSSAAIAGGSAAQGDYMSQAEAEAAGVFKKAGGEKKKKKVRRKKREGDELDLDAAAAADAAAYGGNDRGSRAGRSLEEQRSAEEERRASERTGRFDKALANAEDKTARRLGTAEGVAAERAAALQAAQGGGNGAGAMEVDEGAAEEGGAEVDAELSAALARARRLDAKKKEERHEDLAAQRLAEQVASMARWQEQNGPAPEAEGTELGALEFSETGEFCKAVRAKDDADAENLPSAKYREYKAEIERQTGEDEVGMVLAGEKIKQKLKEEADDDDDDEEEEEGDDDEQEDDEAAKVGLLHERSTGGGGLAGALELMRGRGLLGEEAVSSGRMFDQKGAGLEKYEDEKGGASFSLDYYDEYGRKMSQKQAFRQLSWKFHGKGPSKKRREKRMVEMDKQMAEHGKDRAMEYMDVLQKAQQQTKSAHVVLSGINAIKTADVMKPKQPLDRAKAGRKKQKTSAAAPSGGFDTTVNTMMGLASAIPL